MTNEVKNEYDVIIVGGGASGMMAAVIASSCGANVLLLEKNKRLGEKLRITGGGRCNILNAELDIKVLLKKYGVSEQELYTPFSIFGVKEAITFFNQKGMKLVVEHAKRAFPSTFNATDVVTLFEKELHANNVTVKTGAVITHIEHHKNKIIGVRSKEDLYQASNYIFATGSVSHKETGSTGDGFKWLKLLGHAVELPTPAIVPLIVKEKWVHDSSGVTLHGMKMTFYTDTKKAFSITGSILFTHFGLSGPLILNTASKVADLLHEGDVRAEIDIFPTLDHPDVDKKIMQIFEANKNKLFKNVIKDIVPIGIHKGVTTYLMGRVDISKKVHSITKEERKYIVHSLKSMIITIEDLAGFDKAVIADGGVPLREIETKRMKSKIIDNLYVTGDLLHINRPSGGYSLQLCWTTGYIAGVAASKNAIQ